MVDQDARHQLSETSISRELQRVHTIRSITTISVSKLNYRFQMETGERQRETEVRSWPMVTRLT